MGKRKKSAVLLLAHGSPDSADDVPEFLLHVTGGRTLPSHVIDEVKQRYGLIGASPLARWTFEQRDALQRELKFPVYVGMRNWKPFIADTVRTVIAESVEHVVAICMAPQNSRTSVGLYRSALESSSGASLNVDFVESWHDHPLLIRAFAEKLQAGLSSARREMSATIPVIFTAHSVPERTITDGDPYESQAKETASLVARATALPAADWSFAFQSQGMSGGAWLGPRVEDTILELKKKGHRYVFVQPIGFLCDHVEVLYDIDIGFKQLAEQEGMKLWRAESLNGSPLLTAALVDMETTRLAKAA